MLSTKVLYEPVTLGKNTNAAIPVSLQRVGILKGKVILFICICLALAMLSSCKISIVIRISAIHFLL